MLTTLLLFLTGLFSLVAGANILVRGASKLALSFGISPLVVGLTVVAFGTSAPEMAVSVGAVLDGKTDIAIGNVIGSNIFNILFILGASALIAPLIIHIQVIRQEIPVMLGAALLLAALGLDGDISFYEGLLLLILLGGYVVFLIRQSRLETNKALSEFDTEIQPAAQNAWDSKPYIQILLVIAGLGLLVIGSDWLVSSAVVFAKAMGVSDLIIGLTIVAVGTSLPEVATSLTAALKGERDIAVGNVVGSNTFNILGCVGLSGLAAGSVGLPLSPSVLSFDMWVMLAASFACLPVFLTNREIARWEGGVFLGYYLAYVSYLILYSQEHDLLPAFSSVMFQFIIPLTMITFVAMLIRSKH